ncbi:hypothetical protein LCGC14_3063080, partial [marine sediment metagenome]
LKRIRQFRAQSELTGGQKSMDLIKDAHRLERTKNANEATMDTGRDEIANLKVDRSFHESAKLAAQSKFAMLTKRIKTMDANKVEATKGMNDAKADATRNFKDVEALAVRVVEVSGQALGNDGEALKALAEATEHFAAAETHLRAENQAASAAQDRQPKVKSEILRGLVDDKHLAAIVAAKASAHLSMAEIRAGQLATARDNQVLAKSIEDLAKVLGEQAPAVLDKLRKYIQKPAEIRDGAAKDYQKAEADLEKVLKSNLKERGTNENIGPNIRWIYEGQLADTYLGHYRLTGDRKVLLKAKGLVAKAIKGRERSPHLRPVRQLKAVIDAADTP